MSTVRTPRVLVRAPGVDVARLDRLLGGAADAVGDETPGEVDIVAVSASSPGREPTGAGVVRVPPPESFTDGRPEAWLASRVVRALRRVPGAERHHSPGLTAVVAKGTYAHPELVAAELHTFGVLLFKPGTVVTVEALEDLEERCAECGYSIVSGRTVPAADLLASGVVRRHYGAHWQIARAGRLQPEERLELLRIYDRPGFAERFGLAAPEVEVAPVLEYLARTGIEGAVIDAWSEATAEAHGLSSGGFDGPNELGDLTYVNLFVPSSGEGAPVFLLNPHLPSVTAWFEHGPTPLVALLLGTATADALPWAAMRADFSGGSDPSTSRLGSLRRDMWEGIWPLRYLEDVDAGRTRNGVHLSNGPVEAVREASIWFGLTPGETATGRALTVACGGTEDFLDAPYLRAAGRTRVLVDATRDLTTQDAAALLASGRRLSLDDEPANDATLRRIDLAHHVAAELSRADDVLAVLVGGSVALNRASGDSDLDIIVITSNPERSEAIERMVRSGVTVELEWLAREDALALAAGGQIGDVRELRRSARLGLALPVVDPFDLAGELAREARGARPDVPSALERLLEAYAAFVELSDAPPSEPSAQWAALRGLYDVVAFLLLLASPLRYQKPKWVLADLTETGNADVSAALMWAYGVDHDAAAAARAVETAVGVIATAAAETGLPSAETVRELGLVAEFPEYSYLCHCVDDARSLLADRRWADAAYAAKFCVTMAVALAESEVDAAPRLRQAASAVFAAGSEPALDEAGLSTLLSHLERCKDRLRRGKAGHGRGRRSAGS